MMKQKIVLKYESRPDWYKVVKLVDRVEPVIGTTLNLGEVKNLLATNLNTTVEIQ